MDCMEFVDINKSFQPTKIDWDQNSVLKLIELWEQEDCLYNTKNSLYHNKQARSEALDLIASNLIDVLPGVTAVEVKTKINYLRSQYGRELWKIQDSEKNGVGTGYQHVPTAYWFEKLYFLKDFVTVKRGKSNLSYALEDTSSELDEAPSVSKRKHFDESSLSEKSFKVNRKTKNLISGSVSKNSTNFIWKEDKTENPISEDVLKNGTHFLEKVSEAEMSEDNVTAAFFQLQLKQISNRDLKDEVTSKIILLLYEYKKKNRNLNTT